MIFFKGGGCGNRGVCVDGKGDGLVLGVDGV
jgi:hypothetical protein